MKETLLILTVVVVVVELLSTFVSGTPLTREDTEVVGRKLRVRWPRTGLEICQWLVEEEVQRNCSACFKTADSWQKTKSCVRDWHPASIAKCYDTASGTKKAFNRCVAESYKNNFQFIKKANLYFEKSSKFLNKIAGYSYLEGGPAALFSQFAQDILFSTDSVQEALSTSEDCKRRFGEGQTKRTKYLPHRNKMQPREMEYEYGKVGHDMPFKGVGPLALAALDGMCNTHYLEDQQQLQLLVDSAMSSQLPVPAWIFQEVVKKISSVQI